jgi:kynureninase
MASPGTVNLDRAHAERLDANDALAPMREQFHIPRRPDGSSVVYLCGHSLGLAPKQAARIVQEEMDVWARQGVEGHYDSPRPWLSYHEQVCASLARLVGAQPLEVVAMNSLTVNLHLMLASFYRPTPQRHKILIEKQAFPSDRYAVVSHIRQRGGDPRASLLEVAPRMGEHTIRTEDICALLEREGAQIATVMLPGVQYLNGQCFDMATIAAQARRQGCKVGFDLAHAIGNVPLRLHDWNVDFAVWCSYKYLNGGPGSIGGCFVHERYARDADLPRFAGWWGQDKATRFDMTEQFTPLAGAEGWQISNPAILATAPLLASLPLFDAAGMEELRRKSVLLTQYLEDLLKARAQADMTILTPTDAAARGCQLSIRLHRPPAQAQLVHSALNRQGYLGDWREPDVIRVAPAPLYNTYLDVWTFVEQLANELRPT